MHRTERSFATSSFTSRMLCFFFKVKSRVAFGKPLAEQGTILADIAKSRAEIDQARLLVLKAAYLMDTVGNKVTLLLLLEVCFLSCLTCLSLLLYLSCLKLPIHI